MKKHVGRTSDAAHNRDLRESDFEENTAKMKTTKTYQDHQVISRWAKVSTCPFSLACRRQRSAIRDPYVRDTHDIPWLDFSYLFILMSFNYIVFQKQHKTKGQIKFVQEQNASSFLRSQPARHSCLFRGMFGSAAASSEFLVTLSHDVMVGRHPGG